MASNRRMRDQIANLESRAAAQDRKITILESRAAKQDRIIARLQSSLALLMNRPQNRSGGRSPIVQLLEEPRNNPEDRAAVSNSSMDSTGNIFWNSFEASLSRISAGGDIDLSTMLDVLRNEAFGHIKAWRPIKPEIVRHKRKLIRAILSPTHIHKFNDDQSIITVRENSVWPNIVTQVFPEAQGNKKLRMRLINYCVKNAKSTGKFGKFAAAVVRAHRTHCQSCRPLD